jgi:hypothetical protein
MLPVKERKILDACAGSGNWSKPYRDAGYHVVMVDLPIDIRLFNEIGFWGILAAPPCTVFASSGARWPRTQEEMLEGISVMDSCLRHVFANQKTLQWWALENPIGKMVRYIGRPKMYFQPWEYGDPYTKRTCLWGNFNTPKKSPVFPTESGKIHRMPPSENRTRLRALTPQGFAQAFFEANP